MKAVIFPFTFVPPPYLQGMHTFFPRTVLLREDETPLPAGLQPWVRQGSLTTRVPAAAPGEALDRALKNFQAWAAALYPDGRPGSIPLFKALGGAIPFFDQTSPLKIRADIKERLGAGKATDEEAGDPLFAARLFLRMAREYDAEAWELGERLRSCDHLESRLFQALQGEPGPAPPATELPAPGEDPGVHLPLERLQAWSRLNLALLDADPDAGGLYVTPSRAVFEWVEETVPDLVPVLETGVRPGETGEAQRKEMAAMVAELAAGQEPHARPVAAFRPDSPPAMRLKVYAAAGRPAAAVFAALAGTADAGTSAPPGRTSHLLVALWERLPA